MRRPSSGFSKQRATAAKTSVTTQIKLGEERSFGGVSRRFKPERSIDAYIIWMEESACGRPKKTFNRMGINSENDPAGRR